MNLTYVGEDSVVLKVDTSNKNATKGRQSVRLESKTSYDSGLFIFDIIHTPYGCGLWPALWLTDTYNWPENGEIDVVETNNLATEGNAVTLHTTSGCKMNVKRKETGTPNYVTCDNSTHSNAGCGVQGSPRTYGQEMNENGGGVSLSITHMSHTVHDIDSDRYMHWSYGMPESELGSSHAIPFPTTFRTRAARQTHRHGGLHWLTFPILIAIYPLTSKIKV